MATIGYDPVLSEQASRDFGIEPVPLEDLFKNSDFITIHTPLTKDTQYLGTHSYHSIIRSFTQPLIYPLIHSYIHSSTVTAPVNEATLAKCKKGVRIINCAR
ncbi:hypothetical protein B484DRAFT_121194 [Ochromonadaceae sp. CCMP2298]|nr:hypothetical protein B484DRAFT_121194 [Ochromonadaceae sp. CCMP2298]